VIEAATPYRDVTATAFSLHAEPLVVGEAQDASLNDSTVTAHHVDALSAVSPLLHRTAFHAKVGHSGKFDAVAVAFGADVAHGDIFQHDMVRRGINLSAVVDVQAVIPRPCDDQSAQLQVSRLADV
jgi:hypothetical protein